MKHTIIISLLLLTFFGCSSKTDQEYLFSAQENRDAGNYAEAIADYQELINEYPDSKLAPEALNEMASIYQNKQVKNLSEEESMKKAAEIFKRVYDRYPESVEAPLSLFMSAFILANELKMYDKATAEYELFLKKYPSHSLASSAKEELDNMGLTPEEILKKKITLEN